jgi:UDP-3-O-[3-hydroxymyristoyl] glucosamine N-acyltransferase
MTVKQIAGLVNGRVEGDGGLEITAANDVSQAGPSEIAFVEGVRASQAAADSRAGCLLVSEDTAIPAGRTVIRVRKPRNSFARVLAQLHPPERPRPGIDPTALVAVSAQIGSEATIGPYAVIGELVRVGARSVIGPHTSLGARSQVGEDCTLHASVTLYPGVRVGDRSILHSGCVIGGDGFGFVLEEGRYEKFPQIGSVEIGCDVEIGANSCVDRGALGPTVVGDGAKLDNLVHIGHSCRLGRHVVIAAQTGLSGGVVVEDYVVMGGQVGIGEKAHIRAQAVVGGQCGILPHKVLDGGETYWGTPARIHREYLERLALVSRLPQLVEEIRNLRARLASLEQRGESA